MLARLRTHWSAMWPAAVGSLAAHVVIVGVVATALWAPSTAEQPESGVTVTFRTVMAQSGVGDDQLPPPGEPIDSVRGVANQVAQDQASPLPNADVDTPDLAPARHGGGALGGPDSYTGRDDGDSLRSQIWDHPSQHMVPRRKNSRQRRSPEAIARLNKPGVGQQVVRNRQRARVAQKVQGQATPDELGKNEHGTDGQRHSEARKQLSEDGGGQDKVARVAQVGSTRAANGQPLVSTGFEANETHAQGKFADNVNTAQASNETMPQIMELSQANARGVVPDGGVHGNAPGTGNSALSDRRAPGEGGHRANLLRRRNGQATTHADQQDPYFKRMYARVSSRVVYPDELALMFEQGQVVVGFTLRADGRVANVRVMSSSGFVAFDAVVVAAIRDAAPFGRLPRALSHGRPSMRISAPFDFDNPLIR